MLVLLFLLAVVALIVVTNISVVAFFYFTQDYNLYAGSRQGWSGFWSYFSWERSGWIALAIAATVAVVVLVRWLQLSTGGRSVAEAMGAQRVLPASADAAERRCLNVVAEMALAAGMPVPPLYIMQDERGINAFAAGITPADAVVVVTRGTAAHLRRSELQGVIAHEFSHILNGDMRLNIRLAALLAGITFIADAGHVLLRGGMHARYGTSPRRRGRSSLPALGLVLLVSGSLGTLAAKCIRAAISRQKEYLADAAAVQFTRDPATIGNALKVIGGYVPGTLVHAARAPEMAHLFFARVEHALWDAFDSHPPLDARIRRVDPQWDGSWLTRRVDHAQVSGRGRRQSDQVADDTLAPAALLATTREPLGAGALVLALFLDFRPDILQQQREVLAATPVPGLLWEVDNALGQLQDVPGAGRHALLELSLPALKAMSQAQYRLFRDTLLRVIRADRQTTLREWCYYQLVRHYLDPEFGRVASSRPRYRRLQRVAPQLCIVLSMLAHEGDGDTETAFRSAADSLGLEGLALKPAGQCSVAAFGRAVSELADCYPLLKPRVLKAMDLAATQDGRISPREREIVTAVAAVMDCPLPPAWAQDLPRAADSRAAAL